MTRYRAPLTKDLFDWRPPQVAVGYSADVIGRGRLDNKIARLISQSLRDAREGGASWAEVARKMGDYLGRPVSEAMPGKWSSEGSEDHRIPLPRSVRSAGPAPSWHGHTSRPACCRGYQPPSGQRSRADDRAEDGCQTWRRGYAPAGPRLRAGTCTMRSQQRQDFLSLAIWTTFN